MMRNNEKALIYLIRQTGPIMKFRLVKLMFLISQNLKLYDFVPYKYGPFSFNLYHDLGHLEKGGFIEQNDENVRASNLPYREPDETVKSIIEENVSKYGNLNQKHIIEYVYENYPEYTIFSDYRKCMEYRRDETGITTIGYQGRSFDAFMNRLISQKIHILVDVRKNAFSMKYGFSKSQLASTLLKLGIEYRHIPQLGIQSDKRRDLHTFNDYQKLFTLYRNELKNNREILDLLKKLSEDRKISLMCFEKDVQYCHRGQIADRFRKEGVSVEDI